MIRQLVIRRGALALAGLLLITPTITTLTGATPVSAAVRLGARRATATIAVMPSTDLVGGTHVHVSGRGFAPGQTVVAAECKAHHPVGSFCDETTARFQNADAHGAYAFDLTVNSTLIGTGQGLINCTTRDGACIISVANEPAFDNVTSAPISFATDDVLARYNGAEARAVDAAAATLGVTSADEQRLGTFALAYVLALTHTGPITPPPNRGDEELSVSWSGADFETLKTAAAADGTTPTQFQKTGALFLAYELGVS